MKTIYISPDDLAWMRRRLLGSVHAFAALMVLAGLLQGSSPAPGQTSRDPAPPRIHRNPLAAAAPTDAPTATARHAADSVQREQRRPNPVPPVGWRRTRNGWEHVSNWPAVRPSINELIARQQADEPAWAQSLFRRLRSIPPIGFALFQLTAVALIAAVCEIKRPAA